MPTESRSASWVMSALILVSCATASSALTVARLNTGYDHANFAPYATVTTPVSGTPDSYWINIASYPPTNPAAPTPAWVLKYPGPSWLPAIPGTHWIGPRKNVNSDANTSATDPGYTIFRKCFCLLPKFTQASLTVTMRADDTVQVWFNSQLNVVLSPQHGHFDNPAPLTSPPSSPAWFRVGRNCIYVLVEDTGGWMGFDLDGTIQANGLMEIPSIGPAGKFRCPCESGRTLTTASRTSRTLDDDAEVVAALRQIAEQRRLQRLEAVKNQ